MHKNIIQIFLLVILIMLASISYTYNGSGLYFMINTNFSSFTYNGDEYDDVETDLGSDVGKGLGFFYDSAIDEQGFGFRFESEFMTRDIEGDVTWTDETTTGEDSSQIKGSMRFIRLAYILKYTFESEGMYPWVGIGLNNILGFYHPVNHKSPGFAGMFAPVSIHAGINIKIHDVPSLMIFISPSIDYCFNLLPQASMIDSTTLPGDEMGIIHHSVSIKLGISFV